MIWGAIDWGTLSQAGIGSLIVLVIGILGYRYLEAWGCKSSAAEKDKMISQFEAVVNNNTQAMNQLSDFMRLEMVRQTEQLKQIVSDTDKIETIRVKVGEILDHVKK